MEPIKLSVRKIIDLILRGGDINNQFYDAAPMYLGAAIHRKIQKGMDETYQKEVSLKLETEVSGVPVVLRGRADGVITAPGGEIIIDEIKTTTLPLDYIYEQHEQHLGQGKCYAYMYLQTLENAPENIAVQLTYFQMETEEIRRHVWNFTSDEITSFFLDLTQKYGVWLKFEQEWKNTRDKSISALTFPFPSYRKGQRELAVAVYRTITAGKKLYACAPTGIGKTLSSLFPSIKAMGEGKTAPLFYLTAKTVTRTVAEEAVRLMANNGLRFKAITLRAKDKICANEDCVCNPSFCVRAKGHYDRINDAVLDVIENNDLITPSETEFYAKKHSVCPHEMALDVALWCDLIVGDYNHVFHPEARLQRFFNFDNRDYIFLIDEAHNLTDRVRNMYSAALRKSTFSQIRTGLKDKDTLSKKFRKDLRTLGKYLTDTRKELDTHRNTQSETFSPEDKKTHYQAVNQKGHTSRELDVVFLAFVKMTAASATEWLAVKKGHEMHNAVLDLYFELSKFIMTAEMYDEHFITITEAYGRDITVTLFCLNPSKIIAEGLSRAKSSILFSATLIPLPYYREILGGSENDFMVSLPSPFDPHNLQIISHCGISTKYKDRENSYEPIAQMIFNTINRDKAAKPLCGSGFAHGETSKTGQSESSFLKHKKGNYLIFFPSYDYMHRVYEFFCELAAECAEIEVLLQTTDMSEDERTGFLARFHSENLSTLVGFAVLGGIFSEGIDLKGDRLNGAIIVGVGIPKISLRQDLIRDYFNEQNRNGYDYAYVFPGMNKVLQAAGRVIRTETDTGIVLLIDNRYATAEYKRLFPAHWGHMKFLWGKKTFERGNQIRN